MLGDFINFTKGFAFKSSSFTSKGIKIVKVGNLNSNMSESSYWYYIDESEFEAYQKYQIKDDDVIVSTVGSWENNPNSKVGKACIFFDVKEKLLLNQNAVIIRTNNNEILRQKYLKYLIYNKSFGDYIIGCAQGSANQASITLNDIRSFRVEIPNIKIQDKIIAILDSIILKINLNNKINNNLYEMGDNLYNEYFGKYKDNLPSDYNIVKLNEVADNFDSKRKPMSSREREQHRGIYPYYGATSIIDYVDDYIFDDTYLLMGEDGTVKTDDGYPVLQYIWGKNWINNHAHVLKGKNISTELLMFALRKINIENIITGAVQPKINQENMNKIEFVIGSDSKNKELEDILKKLMDKSKNIIEENKRLEELRDTLLPKLMNGEMDLDKIEL